MVSRALVAAGMILLTACATTEQPSSEPPAAALDTQCADPRPKVCTMEYRPVCAQLADGERQTYPSPCNACADIAVAAWRAEPCEEN